MKKLKNFDDIFILDSKKPGPTVILIAGIHGNEPAGILAFEKLKKIKLFYGKIYFIFGNLLAIKNKKRFIDADLNRLFISKNQLTKKQIKSREYNRSRKIMRFLKKADVLLDIHSTSKKSPPFIICEQNANKIVSYFPFKIRCYGFGGIQTGSTDNYMNQNNKIGICIECGQHNDKNVSQRAINCVQILLNCLKMIKREKLKIKKQTIYKASEIYITKTDEFKLVKKFNNFEKISKRQLIALDGAKKIISQKDQIIIFAKDCKKNEEGFVFLKKLTK
ncbi:succinylglutamate desuccinylase/aspartoacylase family protein [Candidatus Wolfebacteria bacterium]|nr:succinylglutamate desuccinylase/aspartoacylase family protein [Candidatus Wolfebacteria bacterium]